MTSDMRLRAKFHRFRTKVVETGRREGILPGLRLAARWTVAFVEKKASMATERFRDARDGVDTRAERPEEDYPDAGVFDDGTFYRPIPPRLFGRMMRDARVSPERYTFIDLGCGKGAALLLALEHGFRSVVGVELNGRLVEIADENLKQYTKAHGLDARTAAVEADVAHYDFPDEPLFIFLYNPFGADTMAVVLRRLEESIRENPRPLVIAYVSPVTEALLDASPVLRRLPTRSTRWAIWQAPDQTQ